MLPEGWAGVRHILVVRLDNVGDVILLGPALRALRCSLPEAEISLLASPAGSQVAPLLPWIDDVIVLRALWQDVSGALPFNPARELALTGVLRERGVDAALIFTSFSQSPYPPAYLCYLAGIPMRLGQSREFGGAVLTQWVKPLPDETHQVDRNLHLLQSVGFSLQGSELELSVPEGVQRSADNLLEGIGIAPGEPFVLLAPGASAAARRYDPLRFAAVTAQLKARSGLPVVVVGHERESELAQPILGTGPGVHSLVGQTSIPELAGIVRRAALVLCNDSGPMHLADAFRRPMVVLYSGTEFESQWRPRAAPNKLLRRPTPCSPCFAFHCPYNMECLDIPAEEVVAEALALLRATPVLSQKPLENKA